MVGRLFGRKKRPSASADLGDSIKDATLGDVFTVSGLSPEYEESYFIVEKVERFGSAFGGWHELLGVDGDKRLWLQWSEAGGLYITAAPERRPMGLSQLGIVEDDLIRIDEEESIDNYVTYEETRYFYRNSGEAFQHEDGGRQGDVFYIWDFSGEGDRYVLSVIKWEGRPFEVYQSEVVAPDTITVYKR
jgi:hypothetical protein